MRRCTFFQHYFTFATTHTKHFAAAEHSWENNNDAFIVPRNNTLHILLQLEQYLNENVSIIQNQNLKTVWHSSISQLPAVVLLFSLCAHQDYIDNITTVFKCNTARESQRCVAFCAYIRATSLKYVRNFATAPCTLITIPANNVNVK